jgi:GDP-L-fucose synthase
VIIYIAGINGLVGSAVNLLGKQIGHDICGRSSKELNFFDRADIDADFARVKPDVLLIAAAKVGGIRANLNSPVQFIAENLLIQTNLISAAHLAAIPQVIFLGSSCIYPQLATQPIVERALLSAPLEVSNEPFAIAKIAGLKLIEAYRKQFSYSWFSLLPSNLYGPRDNFHLEDGHALPSLMHKIHLAKIANLPSLSLWGDGSPLREFTHSMDLARAILFLLDKKVTHPYMNVGAGEEISIKDLALNLKEVVGFKGDILFDKDSLNGTPRKVLDSSVIRSYGWAPEITLSEGIDETYKWLLDNLGSFRGHR